MPLFTWQDEYALGIPMIDAQHRRWLQIMEDLYQAMKAGRGRAAVEGILAETHDYTREHFSYEESLMRSVGYPEYAEHKELHDDFVARIGDIREKAASKRVLPTVKIAETLKRWLVDHIQIKDQLYGPYVERSRSRR